jgi:hypothetical protein
MLAATHDNLFVVSRPLFAVRNRLTATKPFLVVQAMGKATGLILSILLLFSILSLSLLHISLSL